MKEYNIVEYKNEFNSLYLKLKEERNTSKNLIAIVTNSHLGYIATKYADFVLFTEAPYELTNDNFIYVKSLDEAVDIAIRIINPKDTLLITEQSKKEIIEKMKEYKTS